MASTSRLYYQDSYISTFDAHVVDASADRKRIYLDRTYFYPTSGGQPYDTGVLAGQTVLEVVDEGDRIAHLVSAAVSEDTVSAEVDWSRRYDHMQQHTGQHLLSAVFVELYGIPTLSFHMGAEVSTIELGAKELHDAQVDSVESRVNEIVREGRNVRISFEDASKVQDLRKESSRTGTLRIIEIDGIDRSACGGTHVRSTAELGPIQIRNLEKVRGNVRLEFVCGIRAVRRSKEDFRILSRLTRESATSPEKLADHLRMLRERLIEAEKEQARLIQQLAEREAATLYASAVENGGLRRVLLRVPAIDAQIRSTASALAGYAKCAVLTVAEEPPAVMLACSPDSGMNAGKVLKEFLATAGGRGGGSATLAQGNLPGSEAVKPLIETFGFAQCH